MRRPANILLILLIALATTAAASSLPEQQVDSICAPYTVAGSPGCVVGVVKDGKVILQKGYGLADLENESPLTEKSVLDIGSNAKQFTATAILLLQEQGKLSIDNEVQQYIPEFPKYPWKITLRHLMQHTSGIRDYFDLMTLKGMNIGNNYPTSEYHQLIFSQKELNFPPGEQQLYSNSGFILLAEVVQRVSGESLAQFARKNILEPLEMENTIYCDDPMMLIKHRTGNYGPLPTGEYWRGASIASNIGDGGMVSTTGDLAKWAENYYHNKLGKGDPNLLRTLEQRTVLNSGDTIKWAMGLRHDEHSGHHVIYHGGAYYGFRSEIARFPQDHVTVIVLANLATIDATDLAYKIADVYLPKGDTIEVVAEREPKSIKLSSAQLADKAGKFKNPATGTIWDVEVDDSLLSVSTSTGYNFQLLPLEDGQFRPTGIPLSGRVAFVKLPSGGLTVELRMTGQQPARFQPIKADNQPVDLKQYVGEFRCHELDVTFVLSLEGDILSLVTKGSNDRTPISATLRDDFIAQGGQTQIHFERDGKDKILSMRLSLPRAKNILFERVSS